MGLSSISFRKSKEEPSRKTNFKPSYLRNYLLAALQWGTVTPQAQRMAGWPGTQIKLDHQLSK
jgi:hypothetical protein